MSLVFMDGFETGNLGLWSANYNLSIVSAPTGMSGSYALYGSNGGYAQKMFDSPYSELYFAFKWKVALGHNGALGVMRFYDSVGGAVLSITRNTTTKLPQIRLGDYSGTVLAEGTTVLDNDHVYLFEVYLKPLNSGGVCQVKIDSNPVEINYSGDTTNGLEEIGQIMPYASGGNTTWDDIFVDDADWIGNWRIKPLVPIGAGASAQWDPSTGNNYECVDEKPPSDTDYVSTNVIDEVDTYAVGTLSGTVSAIKAVQVIARARKEGNPTPTQLQLIVRPASTDRVSSSKALPTEFSAGGHVSHLWENNPEDSQPWEPGDINGKQIGMKAVA